MRVCAHTHTPHLPTIPPSHTYLQKISKYQISHPSTTPPHPQREQTIPRLCAAPVNRKWTREWRPRRHAWGQRAPASPLRLAPAGVGSRLCCRVACACGRGGGERGVERARERARARARAREREREREREKSPHNIGQAETRVTKASSRAHSSEARLGIELVASVLRLVFISSLQRLALLF